MPKDFKLIQLRATRLNRKLDGIEILFFCFRIFTIAHKDFQNLDLVDVNSLVVENPCCYHLTKSLNVVVSRPRTEQGL